MDTTIVTLLTIAVVLLSVVVIALLAVITVVLVKVNRIAENINVTVRNMAHATEWLNPAKVFTELVGAFRKK